MNKKFTREQVVELLCIALLHSDEDWTFEEFEDPKMIKGSLRIWNSIKRDSDIHFGDCTKQIQTCCKCLMEHYIKVAENILVEYSF
jgi:hypothetical protein